MASTLTGGPVLQGATSIGIINHDEGLGDALFITDVACAVRKTLEGNTDPAGGREGYVVAKRERQTSDITYFLRIS